MAARELQSQPRPPAKGHRILVVDDHADSRDVLATFLSLQGHDVRAADGGAEALRVCCEFAPDVVFVDLCMPEMDGFELCSWLRQNSATHDAAVYAVTAYAQGEPSSRGPRLGFDAILLKPVELEAINLLLTSPSVKSSTVDAV